MRMYNRRNREGNCKGGREVRWGVLGRVDFLIVYYRAEWQLPGTFFGIKNIVPSQFYCIFENEENT